jgi:D-glycero-alpha-D-manno-heptose 1-phosphate guanylyltransferase
MLTNEAIILAGGLGTRLQHVLPGIPKCMAPVNGKPFLTYVLDSLKIQEITNVVLSVGYRKDEIMNYFGSEYHSVSITYSIENEPLGTGGAIKSALDYCNKEDIFIVNGDTYFNPDLTKMADLHTISAANITIAVKYLSDTERYGLVVTDHHGKIVEFREKAKQAGSGWINGGIYLVKNSIFDNFPQQKFSIENDFFKISCDNFNFRAFQTDAFFLDIGIPEDYARAHTLLTALNLND